MRAQALALCCLLGCASSAARIGNLQVLGSDGAQVYALSYRHVALYRFDRAEAVPVVSLGEPVALARGPAGQLYALDRAKRLAIVQIDLAHATATTLATIDDAVCELDAPREAPGLVVVSGTAYVASGCLVRRVELATGEVSVVAGTPQVPSLSPVTCRDGRGSAAQLGSISGIAIEGGALYISSWFCHSILRIDPASGDVTTASTGSDLGPFALVGDGHVYVADVDTIRMIDVASGAVTTIAGHKSTGCSTPPYRDGDRATAEFAFAHQLALVGGALFVGDGDALRRVDLATGRVTTISGTPKGNCNTTIVPATAS
ncbi:MAG TPA: hypothetical protein VMJ10_18065 [Kofleriaceae bacterium]|nr:hypothetical protein [Kofleriaceae bacterium]